MDAWPLGQTASGIAMTPTGLEETVGWLRYLRPPFQLSAALWLLLMYWHGVPYRVTSGKRSYRQQLSLYLEYIEGKSFFPVAVPGTSFHEKGWALDVWWFDLRDLQIASELGGFLGLWRPMPESDPMHWQATSELLHNPSFLAKIGF